MKKTNILMCCSDLSVKGGMVSVVKNYLGYDNWDNFNIVYIPTHIEKNKLLVLLYFIQAYLHILFGAIFHKYKAAYLHTAERGSFFRKAILVRTLRCFGIKTIMHHHAAEFEPFYEALPENRKQYENRTLEMVDLNIVLSNRLVSMITSKAPNARVKVLYNAVPTYVKNPYCVEAKNILFLGRLGQRKGTYDLLKAIKMLDEEMPKDIQFYLCGDGEIDNVKEVIKKYGIAHRIAHIGWIDAKQKQDYMANTMMNVLPSYHEGLPMSILETMAYGIPNISTNIASIPEVIRDGENGFMIEPGDVKTLAEDIKCLYLEPALREQMSDKSWRELTDRFALDKHISTVKGYITEVLNQ